MNSATADTKAKPANAEPKAPSAVGCSDLLGIWAFSESLMNPPLNLSRPVARRFFSECPAILTPVIATTENQECLLVEQLTANPTMTSNMSDAAERERIPPSPTYAAELVSAVAI